MSRQEGKVSLCGQNVPDGTLVAALAVVPECRVLWSEGHVVYQRLTGTPICKLHADSVGVLGSRESVKRIVCDLIDDMYDAYEDETVLRRISGSLEG